MAIADSNAIIHTYLAAQTGLTDLVSTRIYSPRAPENAVLPFLTFFTRGGTTTNPHIPELLEPSVQFDCWAEDDPSAARNVYRKLYDALQGIQREVVTVSGTEYIIWSAIEEVQGQDLVDQEIQRYFRTLTFFRFVIKAE